MSKKFKKEIYTLIVFLAGTPIIIFLGINSTQVEFFTTKFFWFAAIYIFCFICSASFAIFFSKKFLISVLFIAYFSFFQLYFNDILHFLKIFQNGITFFCLLFFIAFISIISILSIKVSIFRNFVITLLLLNIIISIVNFIPATERIFQTFFKNSEFTDNLTDTKSFKSTKYPNIFYIVPDGLASPKILKNYINIDFNHSIKSFEEKGFDVNKHIYSSYNLTHLSLGALFKMDYPVKETSSIYKGGEKSYPSIRENNPQLLQYLKLNNYKFIIAPPLWGGCPSSESYICLKPENSSFINYFFQDYAIKTFLDASLFKEFITFLNSTKYLNQSTKEHDDTNDTIKTTLNKMKKNPEIWVNGGNFTMIHAYMPHAPYRNEEDCSILDANLYKPHSKEGYRSSVHCTFKRIHEISDFIINNYPNATIVIQADHGVHVDDDNVSKKFFEIPNSFIDHRMGIFSAVKGCNSSQAVKLNQVNIVKYIIECLAGDAPSKQFENKSYYGFYQGPDHGKVFPIIYN